MKLNNNNKKRIVMKNQNENSKERNKIHEREVV